MNEHIEHLEWENAHRPMDKSKLKVFENVYVYVPIEWRSNCFSLCVLIGIERRLKSTHTVEMNIYKKKSHQNHKSLFPEYKVRTTGREEEREILRQYKNFHFSFQNKQSIFCIRTKNIIKPSSIILFFPREKKRRKITRIPRINIYSHTQKKRNIFSFMSTTYRCNSVCRYFLSIKFFM